MVSVTNQWDTPQCERNRTHYIRFSMSSLNMLEPHPTFRLVQLNIKIIESIRPLLLFLVIKHTTTLVYQAIYYKHIKVHTDLMKSYYYTGTAYILLFHNLNGNIFTLLESNKLFNKVIIF